ncbi:hypothetical protein M407DRAFT_5215 [Tulasnella calospora MUT 4182]|uniref:CBM1 domain-containing protein n=1 Tax=Tulasnella calospora MUT 4182 TaxID=1051891 RepID=A0A0C3QRA4_9AGAM|nr:hypothetical protein M407DRAFT_5215 [Tulasnella calospora MUT 4182]
MLLRTRLGNTSSASFDLADLGWESSKTPLRAIAAILKFVKINFNMPSASTTICVTLSLLASAVGSVYGVTPTPPIPTTRTTPSPTPTTTTTQRLVPEFGQCAGINYGPFQCQPGLVCYYFNDYWSGCTSSSKILFLDLQATIRSRGRLADHRLLRESSLLLLYEPIACFKINLNPEEWSLARVMRDGACFVVDDPMLEFSLVT